MIARVFNDVIAKVVTFETAWISTPLDLHIALLLDCRRRCVGEGRWNYWRKNIRKGGCVAWSASLTNLKIIRRAVQLNNVRTMFPWSKSVFARVHNNRVDGGEKRLG